MSDIPIIVFECIFRLIVKYILGGHRSLYMQNSCDCMCYFAITLLITQARSPQTH